MRNRQLKVVGGHARFQVEVRGETFMASIDMPNHKGWEWTVRSSRTDDLCAGDEKTWAAAYRKVLRVADGMAPRRKGVTHIFASPPCAMFSRTKGGGK